MKLVIIIATKTAAKELTRELAHQGYRLTISESVGGFLHKKKQTVLLSVDEKDVEAILALTKQVAERHTEYVGSGETPTGTDVSDVALAGETAEVTAGGATVFVLPLNRAEHY